MLDVESGRLVEPAVVLIEGDRITGIGSAPADADVIDLGDRTLLPGLIDLHTHLVLDYTEPGWEYDVARRSGADFALRGAYAARRTLDAGFTTVRDVEGHAFADIALAKAIDSGWVPGPRIFAAGHAISRSGGHGDEASAFAAGVPATPEYGIADGEAAVRKAVRLQIRAGATVIKVYASGGVVSPGAIDVVQYTTGELAAVVDEAHRAGLKVAAHAYGRGVAAAIAAGVDTIEHGVYLTPADARRMRERNIWLVPTALNFATPALPTDPQYVKDKLAEVARDSLESHAMAIRAGVPIAVGTDAAVFEHGGNAGEFRHLVGLGMSPLQAIRAGTADAAKALGTDDRGRIAVGVLADLIAVAGNPLEDVRVLEHVEFVMKGGTVHKAPATR